MKNAQIILEKSKTIHMVGIKGVGMTALAQILQSRGKEISGSDTKEKFFTDRVLQKLKIPYLEGFDPKNIAKNTDLVIYSTAFDPSSHLEIIEAKKLKLPIISYPEALASLFNSSLGVAISGTHGKTTTSALIANALKDLGLKPTALIGSKVTDWQTNAITGASPFFVIEADEHQNKLRFYNPWAIVLTNIDYDHPDFYPTPEDYYQAFKKWVGKWAKRKNEIPKIGIFNGNDKNIKRLMRELKLRNSTNCIVLTYGENSKCNVRIKSIKYQVASIKGTSVKNPNRKALSQVNFELNLPESLKLNFPKNISFDTQLLGKHNAYNLAATFAFLAGLNLAVHQISRRAKQAKLDPIPLPGIAKSLGSFSGTERRMQYIGKRGRVSVFDDYAHHPAEIEASLKAIKESYPKHKLFVIFQPHTFTRTKTFLKEFSNSLKIADIIGLLEVYGSARETSGNIGSQNIQKQLELSPPRRVYYFKTIDEWLKFLRQYKFQKPTILITMGAGDGWRIGKRWLSESKVPSQKSKV